MALETISGLTLSSQNYSEAIDLLKNRYENPQTFINSYMEQFVNLETVTKTNDVIRLRKLFNKVENRMQNLRSLGVDSGNYGKLLAPVLNSKLPSDMRTLFARKFSGKVWNLDEMLKIFRCELEAKEQASLTVKADKSYEKVERTTLPVHCILHQNQVIIRPLAVIRHQVQGTINLVYFVKAIIHYFAVLKLLIRKFERI